MQNRFEHLIQRYPVPGIEKFIQAVTEIFPGMPDSYVEHFINKSFSKNKYVPTELNVKVVAGIARHFSNIANTAYALGEWKKYIENTIIWAKYNAIKIILYKYEKAENPEFDFENYSHNEEKTESNQNPAI